MNETIPNNKLRNKRYYGNRYRRAIATLAFSLLPIVACTDTQETVNEAKSTETTAHSSNTPNRPSGFMPIKTEGAVPSLDCSNETTWNRDELTDFLIAEQALNLSYLGDPSILASDLRDRTKTSDTLIGILGRITRYGFCNDAPFDVLMLNSGHPTNTASGNVSQHVVGYAVDIRPRRQSEGYEFPHFTSPHVSKTEVIVNHAKQTQRAQMLMGFIMSDTVRPHINQMILSGIDPNWNKGDTKSYTSWPDSVRDYHYDHIHIGIIP